MQRFNMVIVLAIFLASANPFSRSVSAQDDLSADRVRESIKRGVNYLKNSQQDGRWPKYRLYTGGTTALATLALLNAGVPESDPVLQRSIRVVLNLPREKTYVVSLRVMALAMADPQGKKYKTDIARDIEWLLERQVPNGTYQGGWGYDNTSRKFGSADSSNSQFALLALHEGAMLGIEIPKKHWEDAILYWKNQSNQVRGGFTYTTSNKTVTGSMTCAGISSLIIANENLADTSQYVMGDRIICCRSTEDSVLIAKAIDWLARNFSVRGNPVGRGIGNSRTQLYYLYGMERAGRLSGRRFFGPHDWYRTGALQLLRQQAMNGSWKGNGSGEEDPNIATSLALLFLSKGKRPVAIGKLKFGINEDWNLHPKGVHFLTRVLETQWKTKLNWQTIQSENATVQDLIEAPVLFLSGREQLDLGAKQKQELKKFIESGGFIFAESCQGDGCGDAEFDQLFRKLMADLFPDSKLEPLQRDHPIWNSHFPLLPRSDWPILGLQACCRTSVVYVPRSLSCRWQLNQPNLFKKLPERAQDEVQYATEVGVNVVSYATGRELRDKLDVPIVANDSNPLMTDRILVLPKLSHSGGSDDAPNAWRNILSRASQLGMQVDMQKKMIQPLMDELADHPFVFMHGRNSFRFSDKEREELKQFLEVGGLLFADSICSSPAFSEAFRSEMKKMFPDNPLTPIPTDDPIWDNQKYGGYALPRVTITKPDRTVEGGFQRRKLPPQLEGIMIDGHYAVIFSPYDLSCAMENTSVSQCEGYTREDATRIAINVLLYALYRD